ncbi:MAG: tagaturonate reductase [Turicibacter sp.]|nr:tagaturonate reductase [Turicibacter sp.]
MEQLNRGFLNKKEQIFYQDLETDFHIGFDLPEERVLQFGEGNFLRAFVDYFIDLLNEHKLFDGGIVLVQPIDKGLIDVINEQDGLYTVLLRGLEDGHEVIKKRIVTSVTRGIDPYRDFADFMAVATKPSIRFVVSNTTEAGITFVASDRITDTPPSSFPAKVTLMLHERFKHFHGHKDRGLIFIPCELIDNSGDRLREVVLQYAEDWGLSADFIKWVDSSNYFTNTLVDRIVTGHPATNDLDYEDKLLVTAETFNFFAIEASGWAAAELNAKLPFAKAGVNAIVTEDVTPYKARKVRILNGAHTMSVLAAYLAGKETVGEMVGDPLFAKYLKKGIYEEIIPTLDLDHADLVSFADSVQDRFANPYIKHMLLSIALNSVSKFRARVLPSILEYQKRKNALPDVLTFSFAALVEFYRGDKVADDAEIMEFFGKKPTVAEICARTDYWGLDLNTVDGFVGKVEGYLKVGVVESLKTLLD